MSKVYGPGVEMVELTARKKVGNEWKEGSGEFPLARTIEGALEILETEERVVQAVNAELRRRHQESIRSRWEDPEVLRKRAERDAKRLAEQVQSGSISKEEALALLGF